MRTLLKVHQDNLTIRAFPGQVSQGLISLQFLETLGPVGWQKLEIEWPVGSIYLDHVCVCHIVTARHFWSYLILQRWSYNWLGRYLSSTERRGGTVGIVNYLQFFRQTLLHPTRLYSKDARIPFKSNCQLGLHKLSASQVMNRCTHGFNLLAAFLKRAEGMPS